MTHENNQKWISNLMASDTLLRWEIIKHRFFKSEKKELNLVERITEVPLLIIDGIILNLNK